MNWSLLFIILQSYSRRHDPGVGFIRGIFIFIMIGIISWIVKMVKKQKGTDVMWKNSNSDTNVQVENIDWENFGSNSTANTSQTVSTSSYSNSCVVEKEYANLFEELKEKCNPQNFMQPYDAQKVDLANDLYAKILQNENKEEELKKIRHDAVSQLGITIYASALYRHLCIICNPQNFIEPYNAEMVKLANMLYAKVQEKKDNIEELEQIEIEAKSLDYSLSMLKSLAFKYSEKRDFKNAFVFFLKAAEKGDVISQYMVGKYYFEGCGVREDKEEAMKWLKMAADKDNADAQSLYDEWSAEKGDANAQYRMALKKETGFRPYLEKAAKQGHKLAQAKLNKIVKEERKNKMIFMIVMVIIIICFIFCIFSQS